ncbi:MAG: hypothetical protein KDC44_01465, partial [Phaeodactylibacter sp.]|nr:hypothetical protein [Phaeodactylibacter sp.]
KSDDDKKWHPVKEDQERAKHLESIGDLLDPMLQTFKTGTLVKMAKERHEKLMDPATGHLTKIQYAKELITIFKIVEGRTLDYALSKSLEIIDNTEDDLPTVLNPNDPLFAASITIEPFNNLPFWRKMVERGPVSEPKLHPYGDKPKKTPEYAYAPAIAELFIEGSLDKDEIDPNDVIQNQLGDCYFLGSIAAVARANPEAIRQLITDNKDGTYTVKLYADKRGRVKEDYTEITVTNAIPLDANKKQPYAEAGQGKESVELWVMILEKAYAKLQGGYGKIEGGFGTEGLGAITGQKGKNYFPNSMKTAKMVELIKEALDNKWPITAETGNVSKKAAKNTKLIKYHLYAPEAIDEGAQTIDLQNPWGVDHQKGLPLKDFKRYFRWFTIIKDYKAVEKQP